MSRRRKGELSPSLVDLRFPHQVALPQSETMGWRYRFVDEFCRDLSFCPRGHSLFHEDQWWHVYCFREEADAEAFRKRFGGQKFDPAQRGKGRDWSQWKK